MGDQSPPSDVGSRESPPKAIIDTSPLHMDQNKESLKVKLMLRRPLDQLVAQGIMPPHKTPAAFHGQRRQLERAKTGDMLKAKIQQRPSRQELERRHILEQTDHHVDPSLAERQRMLKKAKLADHLNDQLSHRPGPLELIQKNILHTEEPIEQAVKTGQILYKATSEGQLNRPQHPSSYVNPEDDSLSSEGDNLSPGPTEIIEPSTPTKSLPSTGFVVSLLPASNKEAVVLTTNGQVIKDTNEIVFADLCHSVPLIPKNSVTSPASLTSSTSTLSPLSSVASPLPVVSQPSTPIPPPLPTNLVQKPLTKSDAPGKDKNRKKSKSKAVPKARTIKFHEYKGPPSAQKSSNNSSSTSGESSYDLLLQQQTLLLQFQLQLQHKYPQIILPAKDNQHVQDKDANKNITVTNQPSPSPSTTSDSSTSTKISVSARLEDMKVSDLKAELKRRNLPVSGSKPQLIERLKVFSSAQDNVNLNTNEISCLDQSVNSPHYAENVSPQNITSNTDFVEKMDISDPSSPQPLLGHNNETNYQQQRQHIQLAKQNNSEDLVKKQQRQIEELQRELTLSQLKLQAATRSGSEPKIQLLALQKHLQAKQQLQQHQLLQQLQQARMQQQQHKNQKSVQLQQLQELQAKQQAQLNEEQKRIQQQQHVAFQNQKNLSNSLLLSGVDALVFNQLLQGKVKIANGIQRANTLPNIINTLVASIPSSESVGVAEITKQTPPYEEATLKHSSQLNKKSHVKSQIVDDVLEILIKNGELPPSAAQDPITPETAETKSVEPLFSCKNEPLNETENMPVTNQEDNTLGLDPNELLDSLDNLDNMDLSQFVMEITGQPNEENNNPCNVSDEHIPSTSCTNMHMDTDEWLETLLPSTDSNNSQFNSDRDNSLVLSSVHHIHDQPQDITSYDPLLGLSHDPFDPFNLEDFRSPSDLSTALSWDKLDFAT